MGAISVHGVCGALGSILVGVFADGASTETGVLYGGGFHLLGVQTLGVVTVAAYVAVVITVVFVVIKHTIGLRADAADELARPGCFGAWPAHSLCGLCHDAGHLCG